ncbi:glycosyltransferase [Mucilaginibacter arboris]|uniref:Glycosyl transferase family 28 n=1 Tax=Mucilaginibacter arboris TaxID=2682090 RepID=A0A7K1SXR8_9SPHI|nr:glycosyltransferase [Mucilaginibacter arboris]MVN22037.1 glycosyl transferase family 28 [Mucilaginibacter arboris]
MIFVTTGTQEPFDRLIKAIDEIAPMLSGDTIIAQATLQTYSVLNIKIFDFINPSKFNDLFKQADLIVSHAGMGTIISALQIEKPIIIMPRLLKYGEHRNGHQLATAKKFKELNYLHVADNEKELQQILLNTTREKLTSMHKLGTFASESLINSLSNYIK